MDAVTTWAAVGAIGTVVAAGIAAWAARQSRKSAAEANAAAGTLATIERDRRHDELAPEFELKFTETGGDHANLLVALAGGCRMESLDEVTFTILDETGKDHWSGGLPGSVTQEEAEAFVWGPWEFNTAARAQIETNRQSKPRAYSRVSGKTWALLPLKRTYPGHWMSTYSPQQWQEEYADQPVRLLIICRREGYESWELLREVMTGAGPEERKQAGEIRLRARMYDGAQAKVLPPDASKPVHMLVVTNESDRPIRNLVAQIVATPVAMTARHDKLADVVGKILQVPIASDATDEMFVFAANSSCRDLLDAGDNAAFAWGFEVERYPNPQFNIRFKDDREVDWEVGNDRRLKKLDSRDW